MIAFASANDAGSNIVQLAQSVPDLSTLVTAILADTEVEQALYGRGPFTVFAPTNEAFGKIPAATLKHLLDPANIKELDDILKYHVISGDILSKDLKPFQAVKTLEGDTLQITSAGGVKVNDATVTKADNIATNGVVHIIDGVLMPSGEHPGDNQLWFSKTDTQGGKAFECGEVNAAERMPNELFDPSNKAALDAYINITLALYRTAPSRYGTTVKQERCERPRFDKADGTKTAEWAPVDMMKAACDVQCRCFYPKCKDVPDDPKSAHWCSLCGPKFNAPIKISLFCDSDNSGCR
jgi:uncharacterized surface protein with fasciclin (FAS1) repeats